MTFKWERATFTASEAEAITSVSTDQQRNLRRHGYLGATDGGKWTRYDIQALSRLMIIGVLGALGIGPSVSSMFNAAKKRGIQSAGVLVATYAVNVEGAAVDPEQLNRFNEKPIVLDSTLPRYLVAVGPHAGDFHFTDDFQGALKGQAAAIFVDLREVARRIVDSAGKPLAIAVVDEDV